MTTRSLNADELATYLLGKAVRLTLETAPRDPEMQREIEVLDRWIETSLTADEIEHIGVQTGFLFGVQHFWAYPEEPKRPGPDGSPRPDDDPVPF